MTSGVKCRKCGAEARDVYTQCADFSSDAREYSIVFECEECGFKWENDYRLHSWTEIKDHGSDRDLSSYSTFKTHWVRWSKGPGGRVKKK